MTTQSHQEFAYTGYFRINQILQKIPIGRSTWWHWVAIGKAPKPVKLGPRTTAWKVRDIEALIESLANEGGA